MAAVTMTACNHAKGQHAVALVCYCEAAGVGAASSNTSSMLGSSSKQPVYMYAAAAASVDWM
jgi:hypothetical protein